MNTRLQRENFEKIYCAIDGKSALKIIKSTSIDLVLLDIMMPGMSGYEVLEKLQVNIFDHNLMVIMISSNDEIDSVVRCIKLGAEDYLPKPFNREILRARVESCLTKKWLRMREELHIKQIEMEKLRYIKLLNSVFPPAAISILEQDNKIVPKSYNNVAVFFIDIVGFTSYCNTHTENDVIAKLQQFVDICERSAIKYNIQKIKTIGDAIMCTAGLLTKNDFPVLDSINCCLEIIHNTKKEISEWAVRAGINL